MRELGYVEHLHSESIDDKRVTELHGDPARIVECRRSEGRGDFWRKGILQIDDDQIMSGQDVGKNSLRS